MPTATEADRCLSVMAGRVLAMHPPIVEAQMADKPGHHDGETIRPPVLRGASFATANPVVLIDPALINLNHAA